MTNEATNTTTAGGSPLDGGVRPQQRSVTVDSLPDTAEAWAVLRGMYGPNLAGATLVAVIENDGHYTVQTLTFPQQTTVRCNWPTCGCTSAVPNLSARRDSCVWPNAKLSGLGREEVR